MQDNVVNPQSVNEVIQTVFGSYEKFVTDLIEHRKELEIEKVKLLKRLKEIEKEENIIKNILSGKMNSHNASESPKQTEDVSNIKSRLKDIDREQQLVQDALAGFHGKKINNLYFDASSNNCVEEKPVDRYPVDKNDFYSHIAEYLLHQDKFKDKKISRDNLYSEQHVTPYSLSKEDLSSYRERIYAKLKDDYLPNSSVKIPLAEDKIKESFDQGITSDQFVKKFAIELNLTPVNYQSIKI